MLTRNASPALRAWKYGLLLPVFVFLFLLACQKTTQEPTDHKTTSDQPALVRGDADVFELYEVEQPPQFPGGEEAMIRFLIENIQYPERAKSESAEGMVAIVFVVDVDGAITDVEGLKTERSGWRQDFQDEAIRVVKSMPRWEPAISNGKPVKVKFTLPIRFKLR